MLHAVFAVVVEVYAAFFHLRVYFFRDDGVFDGVFNFADVAAAGDKHYAGEHEAHRKSDDYPHRAVSFA